MTKNISDTSKINSLANTEDFYIVKYLSTF